ncbi:MAG: class E sortase [Armatimonadota bacterium]
MGWHQGSAPLGQVGNTVLNGHNTTGGEVFRDLYTLRAGDVLTVYSELEPYTYVVSETLVLPEAGQSWDLRLRNASLLELTLDERVTLVTCHPYGSLRNRLVVIAAPAAAKPD